VGPASAGVSTSGTGAACGSGCGSAAAERAAAERAAGELAAAERSVEELSVGELSSLMRTSLLTPADRGHRLLGEGPPVARVTTRAADRPAGPDRTGSGGAGQLS